MGQLNKAEMLWRKLYEEFERNGAKLDRCNEKDLTIIKDILNTKDFTVWINDYSTLRPYFVNIYGANQSGFESNELSAEGFALYQKLIHPDHLKDLQGAISFFRYKPNEAHETTYRTKSVYGTWRWIYTYEKAFHFKEDGSVKYILTVVFDIIELIGDFIFNENSNNHNGFKHKVKGSNKVLISSLTNRELDIIHLIGNCKTSKEISSELNISAATVDTHRKNLIKKLNLKNSMDIVRFAAIHSL